MSVAVFPGSFDPVTLGHVDIIRRAAACFDRLVVCVMVNSEKKPMFTAQERMGMLRAAVADIPNAEVDSWDGLLADYAARCGASVLVKGVRNASDFDWEYQLAAINRGLCPTLETVLLPARSDYQHFSSTMVREMIRYGQPMERYVPEAAAEEIKRKGWA